MLTGVAFCPQAPALVPAVGRGADVELGAVRTACRTAVQRVAASGAPVVVVGSDVADAIYGPTSRGSFAGFGVDLDVALGSDDGGPLELPAALAVGAWLVRDALGPDSGAAGHGVASALPVFDGDVALVVVGDGSARRSEKAPGHLDDRAAGRDALVRDALRIGDPNGLRTVGALDRDLLVAGAPVWDAVARALAGTTWDAALLYDDAPLGVGYLVATWTAPGTRG